MTQPPADVTAIEELALAAKALEELARLIRLERPVIELLHAIDDMRARLASLAAVVAKDRVSDCLRQIAAEDHAPRRNAALDALLTALPHLDDK